MSAHSFILYNRYFEQVADLTDLECGLLFRAILKFTAEGVRVDTGNRLVNTTLKFILEQIEFDQQQYAKTCKRNKKIAEIRWDKQRGSEVPQVNSLKYHGVPKSTTGCLSDSNSNSDSESYSYSESCSDSSIREGEIEKSPSGDISENGSALSQAEKDGTASHEAARAHTEEKKG